MFNWTVVPKDKGRIKQLIIEFEPEANGDVQYEVGYEDEEEFVPVEIRTLHFELAGVQAIISAIQGTGTMEQAKDAVEALLVAQLDEAS